MADIGSILAQFGQSMQSGPPGASSNPYPDFSQLLGGQGVNPLASFLNIANPPPPLSAYQPHGYAALAQQQIDQSLAQYQADLASRIAAMYPQQQPQAAWSQPPQVSTVPTDFWERFVQSQRGF